MSIERQFTATAYIVEEGRVLLIFHRKFNKWLPPGGHLQRHETPCEAARREVLEETGLSIEFIIQENVSIDRWNARSLPRPYLCLLEEIPSINGQPPHQHIDMIYLAKPCRGRSPVTGTERVRWFTLDEVEILQSDVEMFEETKQTIRALLKT